jgi:O-acetyl-ADP-ribose deacetylase (regulator of RNase III)
MAIYKMKEIEGDLISMAANGDFDVIIHGCNCQCQMGKGIALKIRNNYPEAYEADCKTEKGSREKLGSYSAVNVKRNRSEFTIVNAYTQFHWKGKGVKADYEAIRSVFKKIKNDFSGKKIGYPLLGAGLAGGDWGVIKSIIDEQLIDEDHTLVRFKP